MRSFAFTMSRDGILHNVPDLLDYTTTFPLPNYHGDFSSFK